LGVERFIARWGQRTIPAPPNKSPVGMSGAMMIIIQKVPDRGGGGGNGGGVVVVG
jgi:hypothetical protein